MPNGVLPIWSKWGICITPTQKMGAFISSIGILCTPGFLKGQCHSLLKNHIHAIIANVDLRENNILLIIFVHIQVNDHIPVGNAVIDLKY